MRTHEDTWGHSFLYRTLNNLLKRGVLKCPHVSSWCPHGKNLMSQCVLRTKKFHLPKIRWTASFFPRKYHDNSWNNVNIGQKWAQLWYFNLAIFTGGRVAILPLFRAKTRGWVVLWGSLVCQMTVPTSTSCLHSSGLLWYTLAPFWVPQRAKNGPFRPF